MNEQTCFNYEGASIDIDEYFAGLVPEKRPGFKGSGIAGMRQSAASALPPAVRDSVEPAHSMIRYQLPPTETSAATSTSPPARVGYMAEDGIRYA